MSYTSWLRGITCGSMSLLGYMLACVLLPVPGFSGERPPLTLRAGPGAQHAVVATLPLAYVMEFIIVDEHNGWSKVRVADGQEGWLQLPPSRESVPEPTANQERSTALARPTAPPPSPPAERPSKAGLARPAALPVLEPPPLTLRAGPGEQHAVVATLPLAYIMEFIIVDEHHGWSKVRLADGQTGWLQLPAPREGPPVATANPPQSVASASPAAPSAQASATRLPEPASPSPAPQLSAPAAAPLPEPTLASPGAAPTPAVPGPSSEPRTALVIGNAAYESEMGALRNARNDAEDMATTLRALGFEVTLLVDAGHESMDTALHAFLKRLRQQRGVGLFYFAGHGAELDGRGYLFPVRSGIRERWQLPYKAMHVAYIQAALEEAGNRMNLIILDACRNIPTFEASARTSRGMTLPGLPPMKAGPDMVIAYATSPGEVALDGDTSSRNGVYTKHLLQALTMPGLSVEDVFRSTLSGVLEATKGKQRPWSSVSLAERFEFVPASGTAAQSAPRAEPPAKVATENRPERSRSSARNKPGGPR